MFTRKEKTTQGERELVEPRTPLWQDESLNFSGAEIEAKLKKLNMDKSPGPDGMHPRLLNSCAAAVTISLSIQCIFQLR